IEPRPDRLDRQLLEVMISEHPSGLKVIAAPSRPAEMRSFDFEVVTRLLDLVASHFDNVVIDVPRTWFAWTDSVLIGSNRLFLVTEMTVPGLKHARHLVNVIRERLADGPRPEVIVNRFEQRLFGPGLRRDATHRRGAGGGCCGCGRPGGRTFPGGSAEPADGGRAAEARTRCGAGAVDFAPARQAARRESAAASPPDRGDQSLGDRKSL